MYRLEDIEALEDGVWKVSRRWRCCICGEGEMYLTEPWAGLGVFCCGDCGMSGMRLAAVQAEATASTAAQAASARSTFRCEGSELAGPCHPSHAALKA
jgi:hypothetical protein